MPGKEITPGNKVFVLSDFSFDLPDKLIAQYPSDERDQSRLFILNRNTSEYLHKSFYELEDYLFNGDVLVLNNARVIPARMFFKRESGGLVELVLTRRLSENEWLAISNRTRRMKPGEVLVSGADQSVMFNVLGRVHDFLKIRSNIVLTEAVLKKIGEIPLPPYIKRSPDVIDEQRYQTVYSREGLAAAAPTAGLHFTDDLINKLKAKGVVFVFLTLDVSWGTFQPVRDNDLTKHRMHVETYDLPAESAEVINAARTEGRRIIAVGTTSLRVLESTFKNGLNIPGRGETDIFIYPPYEINSINAMITNFHTPYSTLLMLVSAFAGYEKIMDAYRTAVLKKYRFFSYGDSMLIL